jgi:hypothetical protein
LAWELFVGALQRFWIEAPHPDRIYRWSNLPVIGGLVAEGDTDAQKVSDLRQRLSAAFHRSDDDRKIEIAGDWVRKFGGIYGNGIDRIASYVDADPVQLSRTLTGIGSWSKVLSIREPTRFAIYDSRVALQLNYLQLAYLGKIVLFFPLPASNAPRRAKLEKFIEDLGATCASPVPRHEAYAIYLRALDEVSQAQSCSIEAIEMQLFAACGLREGTIPYTSAEQRILEDAQRGPNVHWFRGAIGQDPYTTSIELWEMLVSSDAPAIANDRLAASLGHQIQGRAACYALLSLANEEFSQLQRQAIFKFVDKQEGTGDGAGWDMAFDQLQQAANRFAAQRAMARLLAMRVPTDAEIGHLPWDIDGRRAAKN